LAAVYGCGENYPLPEPKAGSAWERFSEQRNRRVEFLFFDRLLGISPEMEKPQIAAPGSKVYPAWIAKAEIEDLTTEAGLKEVTFVEMHDALFRTNSAVILPEGEDPSNKKGGGKALTSVGLFATVLRYNEEHAGKKLFIAGHTDTAGGESTNQPLSEERAKVALAILSSDRGNFAKLCQKRHDGVDLTQIFHWVADSPDFTFNCKPTRYDQPPNTTTVTYFKQAYDAAFDAKFKDMPGAKKFGTANGTIDEALWGAIFDCYEYGLCCELGDMETSTEGKDELTRLRGELRWVDDGHKTMGFGEKFPIDNVTKNDFRSQSNRRVEIMMFDDGEEPDLAAAATNPEIMETYLPGVYGKVAVKPMKTAKRVPYKLYFAVKRVPPENPTKLSYKVTESETKWEIVKTTADIVPATAELDALTFRIPPTGTYSLWLLHSGTSPMCLMRDMPYEKLSLAGPTSAFRESSVGVDDVPDEIHALRDDYVAMV
jgi:outer membrane protein OmpA-like peptidoglycan-associated protein